MSLSVAVNSGVRTIRDAQASYRRDFLAVNTAVASVLSSALPVLQLTPANWPEIQKAYLSAQTAALDWFNGVAASLLAAPGFVLNNTGVVTATLNQAASDAQSLATNPSQPQLASDLQGLLNLVATQLGTIAEEVGATASAVQGFDSQLPALTATLSQLVSDFSSAQSADTAAIAQLSADVAQLNADIQALQNSVASDGDASTATIWLSRFVPAYNAPLIALKLFLIAVSATAEYYVALDTDAIQNDLQKISNDQQQISGVSADVAALRLHVDAYQSAGSQVAALATTAQALASAWQSMVAMVSQAVTAVTAACADSKSVDYTLVSQDIGKAIGAWTTLNDQAVGLNLDVQVNTAVLQPGSSPATVLAALSSGRALSLSAFVNAAGQ